MRSLIDKYEKMTKRIEASLSVNNLLTSTNLPSSEEVMAVLWPPKFRVPYMEMYNKSKDPLEQLETFKAHITLHGFLEEIACRAFKLTLKGAMRGWFRALQPSSINSFSELAKLFLTQSMVNKDIWLPISWLSSSGRTRAWKPSLLASTKSAWRQMTRMRRSLWRLS